MVRLRQAVPTLLLGAGAIVTFQVLSRLDPYAKGSLLPPCPFHALTGWFCPGCGSTRALHALIHGDAALALAMNPLLVVVLPLLAWMALSAAGISLPGRRLLLPFAGNPRIWLVALLGYWVLRNLPWMPFAWLAPG